MLAGTPYWGGGLGSAILRGKIGFLLRMAYTLIIIDSEIMVIKGFETMVGNYLDHGSRFRDHDGWELSRPWLKVVGTYRDRG